MSFDSRRQLCNNFGSHGNENLYDFKCTFYDEVQLFDGALFIYSYVYVYIFFFIILSDPK